MRAPVLCHNCEGNKHKQLSLHFAAPLTVRHCGFMIKSPASRATPRPSTTKALQAQPRCMHSSSTACNAYLRCWLYIVLVVALLTQLQAAQWNCFTCLCSWWSIWGKPNAIPVGQGFKGPLARATCHDDHCPEHSAR